MRSLRSVWSVLVLVLGVVILMPLFGGGKAESGPLKEVTLTFYMPGEPKKDLNMVLDAVQKKSKSFLNAKINFNYIPWDDFQSKVSVLLASGDTYEGHFDGDWFLFPVVAQKGALLDITELLPKYAPNLYKKYTKQELEPASIGGKIVAIPWLFPTSLRRCFIVREDLKAKYSEIPAELKSWQDFETYLKVIKDKEPGIVPYGPVPDKSIFTFCDAFGWAALSYPVDLVYSWNDPSMKIIPWEQTSTYATFVKMMRNWYQKGYLPADPTSIKDYNVFPPGKYASTIYLWDAAKNWDMRVQRPWKLIGYPISPDKVATLASPMYNAVAFNKNGANPERAITFMEWVMASQENYDLLQFGIKGVHYELEGDTVKQPKGLSLPENPWMDWEGEWAFQNLALHRFNVELGPNFKKEWITYARLNTRYIPSLGFTPNLDPVKTEVAQRAALYEEMGRSLEYGLLPLDKIDEYVQKQKQAGTDKIVAEVQRQLNEWVAARK